MIKRLKKLWWPEGFEDISTPEDVYVQFLLKYEELIIGTLTLDNGEWIFEYSEEFKHQKTISPLANFPTLEKVYRSNELWPFFASRIPSINQLISTNKKVEKNEATLLKKYGTRTITNPFVLIPAI
jgi:HipA-like protein